MVGVGDLRVCGERRLGHVELQRHRLHHVRLPHGLEDRGQPRLQRQDSVS